MSLLAPVVPLNRSEACPNATVYVSPACPPEMARTDDMAWCVEDYELVKQLYRGKASLLYRAVCRRSRQTVALKLYRKHKLSTLNWYQVAREIQIHAGLDHPHIIGLYGAFEDTKHVYLVQEFAPGGDLYEELKRVGGRFRERDTAARILAPALQALAYCQARGVIHRDIKPENILLGHGRALKLADFGLSVNDRDERPVTRCGTLEYMTPEVLGCPEKCRPEDNKECEKLWYGRTVDSWAIGVLAYELITGKPPFERETRAATYEAIMYRRPAYPAWMTTEARSFIDTALHKDAHSRPGVLDLLQHAFITAVLPTRQAAGEALRAPEAPALRSVPPPQSGAVVSSFAVEAARRQAQHKSSFQGATVQRPAATAVAAAAAGSPSATPTAKRALPDLRKTESVPDVLAATLGLMQPGVTGTLMPSDSLPIAPGAEDALSQMTRAAPLLQAASWGLPVMRSAGSSCSVASIGSAPSRFGSKVPPLDPPTAAAVAAAAAAASASHHQRQGLGGDEAPHGAPLPPGLEEGEAFAQDPGAMAAIMSWAGAGVKSLARVFGGGDGNGGSGSGPPLTFSGSLPPMAPGSSGPSHSGQSTGSIGPSAHSAHSHGIGGLGGDGAFVQPSDMSCTPAALTSAQSGEVAPLLQLSPASAAAYDDDDLSAEQSTAAHKLPAQMSASSSEFSEMSVSPFAARPASPGQQPPSPPKGQAGPYPFASGLVSAVEAETAHTSEAAQFHDTLRRLTSDPPEKMDPVAASSAALRTLSVERPPKPRPSIDLNNAAGAARSSSSLGSISISATSGASAASAAGDLNNSVGLPPSPVAKRKRFSSIRRAWRGARPATAHTTPSGSGNAAGAGPGPDMGRPASSGGLLPGQPAQELQVTGAAAQQHPQQHCPQSPASPRAAPTPAPSPAGSPIKSTAQWPGSAVRSRFAAPAPAFTRNQTARQEQLAAAASAVAAKALPDSDGGCGSAEFLRSTSGEEMPVAKRPAAKPLPPPQVQAPAPVGVRPPSRSLRSSMLPGGAEGGSPRAAEPDVERSASSMPTAKAAAHPTAASPFGIPGSQARGGDGGRALDQAAGAACLMGENPLPEPRPGAALPPSSALLVPAVFGSDVALPSASGGTATSSETSLTTTSIKDLAQAVATAAASPGADSPTLVLLDDPLGGAGAAEVLEMLHHADSCDLGAPHMQEVTLTGEAARSRLRPGAAASGKAQRVKFPPAAASACDPLQKTASPTTGVAADDSTPAAASVALFHQRSDVPPGWKIGAGPSAVE